MKTTKTLFLILVLSSCLTTTYAQFKMTSDGNVEIGLNNSVAGGKLTIGAGGLVIYDNYHVFRFLAGNPGTEIGSSYDEINFYYNGSWNSLYAEGYYTGSDTILKKDIKRIHNPINYLKNINGYSYYLKDNPNKLAYGVIAQEVEKVIPSIVDTSKGIKLVNYNAFIPFLLEGLKYQQHLIDSLINTVRNIEQSLETVEQFQNKTLNDESINNDESKNQIVRSLLFQNTPNPFSQDTKIKYFIPSYYNTAYIVVYSLDGAEVSRLLITTKGYGEIIINGSELHAGTYVYTLITDNNPVDSKVMILTR